MTSGELLDESFDSRKELALPVWESNPGLRVTGGDTVHYTNEELCMEGLAPANDTALRSLNKACLFPILAQPLNQ